MTPREVPFPAFQLSPEEQQHCHERIDQLLQQTLLEYDERDGRGAGRPTIPLHHSNLDSVDWKLLKTQDVATLYTERDSSVTQNSNLLGVDWNDPVVILMVGRIRGDLEEVMLGIEMPDFAALKTRAETFTKQAIDGAVLAELQGPTEDDPFWFLGVQWTVVDHNWPLKAMVRPRDFVDLTSTGMMTRANGDRIGYEIVLPANLPQCLPLPKPVVRGQVMHAAIFRQQEPGVVDAYVHAYIETQNSLLDKVVVSVAWKSTIMFWDSPQLAELKKLQCYDERDGQGETIPRHHSILDNTRWKMLKTHADASLYMERDSRSRRDLNQLGGDWENPVVIMMAGTIRADLDEVMLGMVTPDFDSLKVRTEEFAKQLVDGAVLVDLMHPTEDEPFQSMGIHWVVIEPKWPVKAVVHPRDFVALTSTGIMTRENGDRIGYEVVLPANLSQCPPLAKPFVRGKFMHASIFKQQEPGVVDVYVHALP
ncbi:hypothetical protein BBP00_00004672 [Phytophthora kernoviae]|uniref:START domain-containing protein n=1 Tax=Phytophthora kernoviae TaxID=325452 RepID=A0A3F2RR47_9STRA|nr:hypothetical protein BBP00_00004672 [Phytophthora kernoviae]